MQTGLRRPVLVGWSYGGRVINDYLTHYGDGGIAGIDYVAAMGSSICVRIQSCSI